jgi:hypothetical protein
MGCHHCTAGVKRQVRTRCPLPHLKKCLIITSAAAIFNRLTGCAYQPQNRARFHANRIDRGGGCKGSPKAG